MYAASEAALSGSGSLRRCASRDDGVGAGGGFVSLFGWNGRFFVPAIYPFAPRGAAVKDRRHANACIRTMRP